MLLTGATEPEFHTLLVPYIPLIVAILSGLMVGGFAIWNRRRGAVESKIPTVSEVWAEQRKNEAELDLERRMRRWFESSFWALVRAFRSYIDRVVAGGSVELKSHERSALEAQPPDPTKE